MEKEKTGLGERLKALREKEGVSQPALAAKLGFAPGTISRWERETGEPQADQLRTLARHFKVSLDYLLFGEEPDTDMAVVHSAELHRFLDTTAGKRAKALGFVDMLVSMRYPQKLPPLEVYRGVANLIAGMLEAAADEEQPTTDTHKKQRK